jgi:hypothetical protein
MLAFSCPVCARLVTFQAVSCLNCGSGLAYDPATQSIRRTDESGVGRLCANASLVGCNWLATLPGELCESCALTRTRPADSEQAELARFAEAESAKRWLLFELHDLGLPVEGRGQRENGLAFDLLSSRREPVTTGHADGVITLDLAEADPASREPRREQLGERYRTVLGHLRHEIGHYYQPILVPERSGAEAAMREHFGDERLDYGEAMDAYYRDGPPSDWQERFVSAYASMHPWEDWAETFAHYLHIRDTSQTAVAYGVTVSGPSIPLAGEAPLHSRPLDPLSDVRGALEAWIPLTFALNQISRSMGQPDTYPFVLPAPALEKLRFIGGLIVDAGAPAPAPGPGGGERRSSPQAAR